MGRNGKSCWNCFFGERWNELIENRKGKKRIKRCIYCNNCGIIVKNPDIICEDWGLEK